MVSRQQAVLSYVKFNKFFKQLNYDITVLGQIHLSQYAEELMDFEQWVNNVVTYVNFNPDPIIIEQISALGSSKDLRDYIEESKMHMPNNSYDALSCVLKSTAILQSLVTESVEIAKGKFTNLPEAFAYQDAADLFERAVEGGLLTQDYQPKGDTDIHTLKIIAFAIGDILKLTPRHKWSHFEELWNIDYSNKLSSLPISDKQFHRNIPAMALYPEVDFNALIKPKDNTFFFPAYGLGSVKVLHKELKRYGYISKETKLDDFLSIFNLGKSKILKPVEWISDQRHLSYFIHLTFSKTNKDIWIKTHACFTVNGATPNTGTMKSGLVSLQAKNGFETYDLELKRIASNYNKV